MAPHQLRMERGQVGERRPALQHVLLEVVNKPGRSKMPLYIVEEAVDIFHIEAASRRLQSRFRHDQTELYWAHSDSALNARSAPKCAANCHRRSAAAPP